MNKIVIPLDNGYKLIAEQNTGEFDKEFYIGIETESGVYIGQQNRRLYRKVCCSSGRRQ